MAPMNTFLGQLFHIFHPDEPEQGSSDNSPVENLRERLAKFFRHIVEHFFHPQPCPPSQSNGGGDDTSHQATPPWGAGSGTSEDDGDPEHGDCVQDHIGPYRWLGANTWVTGFANTDDDHVGGGQETSRSQHEAAAADHQAGPNLAQLVQAMASHFAGGGASDFGSSSDVATDPAPQSAIAAAWQH